MFTEQQWYKAGRKLIGAYRSAFLDLNINRNAPLPNGAFVLAANHPTSCEPVFLPALIQRPMSIMISESVFHVPLVREYLRASGHIKVAHGAGIATLSQALHKLEAGVPVAIFPEGGLSPLSGGFLKPHSGAVRLALAANVPIVPLGIAVDRTRIRPVNFMLGGKKETAHVYLTGQMTFTLGAPMQLMGDVNDWREVERLSEQMMDEIKSLACQSAWHLAQTQSMVVRAWSSER